MPDASTDAGERDVVICLGVRRRKARSVAADLVSNRVVVDPLAKGLVAIERSWGTATWGTAVVVAADIGWLRLATPVIASCGAARRVVVHVVDAPAVLIGQPWRWPAGAVTAEFTAEAPGGGCRWSVGFDEPTEVGAVVTALRAHERRPGAGGLRVAAGDRGALEWCVDDPLAPTIANAGRTWRGRWRPLMDVVLRTTDDGRRRIPAGARLVVADRCPPVDPAVSNPREFRREGAAETVAELVVEPDLHRMRVPQAPGARPVRAGVDTPLTTADVTALRGFRHLDLAAALANPAWTGAPLAAAKALTRLAGAGVPLVTGPLPAAVAAVLHADVVAALEDAKPALTEDATEREVLSIRQRRAALRHYAPAAAWACLRQQAGLPPAPARTVSVLVATKRPHLVERALRQAGGQRHVRTETILVTHGFELPATELRRLRRLTPSLTVRTAAPTTSLGEALNLAVEAAAGDVVSKMDDDDWYGPHHLEDLVQALEWSGAMLVGVVDEFSFLADVDTTVRHPSPPLREISATRVAGPSMTIRRDDLLALGGWRPVEIHEDLALNNAVWRSGGTAHQTHGLGYLRCRHGLGHTWEAESERFLQDAVEQWAGFHPPPEMPADTAALEYYETVRARPG